MAGERGDGATASRYSEVQTRSYGAIDDDGSTRQLNALYLSKGKNDVRRQLKQDTLASDIYQLSSSYASVATKRGKKKF